MTDERDDDDDEHDEDEAGGELVHLDFKKRGPAGLPGEAGHEKLAAFQELIARGKTMVTLDARRPGVRVPKHFKDELQLNLDFSTRFAGVVDFEWDDVGVRSTLTFGGQPTYCDVPWSAVWAMRSHVDNQMMLWPEDLPEEMLAQLPEAQMILKAKREDAIEAAVEAADAVGPAGDADGDPAVGSAVGSARDQGGDPDKPDGSGPGKGRPGLRLVK